jgi:hypothetical protein
METKYGIPTVGVHVSVFAPLVRSAVKAGGMPYARQAFVPTPLMNSPAEVVRGYVAGDDPVSKRPFMTEVFELLTRAVDPEDLRGEDWDRDTPRHVEADSEEEMHALFRDRHFTDYLPIILPTEERVEAMLGGTTHARDEMVGKTRPTIGMEFWHYDVEKIAINAVMAGCAPEHLPVLLAIGQGGDTGRQSSMSSMGNMVVVNGPIRHEIDMNSGIGALGPYNYANAVIGRGFGIMSQNLQGGSVPGLTYNGSQGCNFSYNCITYAENEERSPWEPFHVQRGFRPDVSTVSVFTGCRSTAFTLGLREKHWREHVRNLLRGMDPHGPPTLLLDPIAARQFIDRGGFTKKEALVDWLYDTARMPAGEYWDYQLVQNYIYPRATFGEEPWASKLRAAPDELIPMFRREDIHIVVVGGETNGYWRIMGCTYQNTVSVDEQGGL